MASPLPKTAAVVAAAGSGSRFKGDKLFADLKGRPVIVWTLKALEAVTAISEIVPVMREGHVDRLWELINRYAIKKVNRVAVGGPERQDSVYNGLSAISDEAIIALIHDGARPLVKTDLLETAIEALLSDDIDGVVIGVPVKDTVKKVATGDDPIIQETLDRRLLWLVQTPQVFYYKRLMEAFKKAYQEGYYATDDSALMERYGARVRMLMGNYENIKITTPEDVTIAGALMAMGGIDLQDTKGPSAST